MTDEPLEPGAAFAALLAAADALMASANRDHPRARSKGPWCPGCSWPLAYDGGWYCNNPRCKADLTHIPDPIGRLREAAAAVRPHVDQVATWGARIEEVYRLLGLHPDTSWGVAMDKLLEAREGARHYADLALKQKNLVRACEAFLESGEPPALERLREATTMARGRLE